MSQHHLTRHAELRMQQRGVTRDFLNLILEQADVERFAGCNCRLYRVTKGRARALGNDKLARFAAIWSDERAQVVTVLPIAPGAAGARYRRKH